MILMRTFIFKLARVAKKTTVDAEVPKVRICLSDKL